MAVKHFFRKGEDKYSWRGDADTFDTDLPGPGHVPENDGSRESMEWSSYNWGGEKTNDWGQLKGSGKS